MWEVHKICVNEAFLNNQWVEEDSSKTNNLHPAEETRKRTDSVRSQQRKVVKIMGR